MSAGQALRGLLAVGGIVATGSGVHTALAGARAVPGHRGAAGPVLESELRFFGAFYAAYGLAVLRAARREPTAGEAHAAAGALLAGGLARAAGWRSAGRPSAGQRALLAVELTAPPLVAALARRARS